MKTADITERLDSISKDLNGIIGRLTLLRNHPIGKESHELAILLGGVIDDLINEIDDAEDSMPDPLARLQASLTWALAQIAEDSDQIRQSGGIPLIDGDKLDAARAALAQIGGGT